MLPDNGRRSAQSKSPKEKSQKVELVEEQIEYGKAFYYAAGMCCLAGGITIFVYPEQGIGLIVFGGILPIWSLGNVTIAAIRDVSAKLAEIISRLDAVERKN